MSSRRQRAHAAALHITDEQDRAAAALASPQPQPVAIEDEAARLTARVAPVNAARIARDAR